MRETISASDSALRRAQIVVKRSLVRRRKPTQPDVVAPPTEPTFKASDSDLDPYFYSTPVPFPEA